MPLPMVHFAVAVGLGERSGHFPSPAFLLGSIAPDSIHMRPEAVRGDKAVTHLDSPADTPDHARLRALVEQYKTAVDPYPSFTAGYAAHILTDRYWIETVIEPFRASAPQTFDGAEGRKFYYQETDQADYNLYQRSPWQPEVWSHLAAAEAPDYLPLLSNVEINLWRERTLRWFENPTHNPGITARFATDDRIDDFITRATDYVAEQFQIWEFSTALI
jgi:hypothetical protein